MKRFTTSCKCFLPESYVNSKAFKNDFSCFLKKQKNLTQLLEQINHIMCSNFARFVLLKFSFEKLKQFQNVTRKMRVHNIMQGKPSSIILHRMNLKTRLYFHCLPSTLIGHEYGFLSENTLFKTGKFENAPLFLRLGLPSTLIHHENGPFLKRSSNQRNLKTALRSVWTENNLNTAALRKQ